MSEHAPARQTVALERELPHPPDRIWRALTQPALLAEWLMANDFHPRIGHDFAFRAEWGAVQCKILELEPCRRLSYSWQARGLVSVVAWTLTQTGLGTLLRMEHTGFQPDQQQAFQGATHGWQKFLAALERLLDRPEPKEPPQ